MSFLLFVAFWWKEVVFFSSFRQFKPIAVPRPVVLQQVQTLRVHTNDWAVACSVQQWVWSTLPVRPLSRCSLLRARGAGPWSLEHASACVCSEGLVLNYFATAQLAVHTKTESSGFVGNLIRQRPSRCRILSQNVQLSTNDRAFARRVSSVKCTTWVRSLHTPKSMFFTCPNISHSSKQETPTATTLNNKNER